MLLVGIKESRSYWWELNSRRDVGQLPSVCFTVQIFCNILSMHFVFIDQQHQKDMSSGLSNYNKQENVPKNKRVLVCVMCCGLRRMGVVICDFSGPHFHTNCVLQDMVEGTAIYSP